jgi:2,4-dienoyl-CoA reductase-like NADH-dependent reductase (Old Yellow Enzyme family)
MLLRRSVLGMEPVGPSPGQNPATGDEVRALTRRDIVEIQEQFLTSAVRLYRAGYDAIELHAANGYLFQQFFTPRHNWREDDYGGPVENRAWRHCATAKKICRQKQRVRALLNRGPRLI